ncbi:SMI1/KNR4 family protein [Armatimonas sp.]|uniref:SMI1/KNR4 family protein n=1 Tax=Armatimonas sp. TaxID=1872638 RepID=UPI003752C640
MNELLNRFDVWLAANLLDYYASLQPGVTDAELDAFETKLGHPLTDDFRALYKWHNGSLESGFPPLPWYYWLPLQESLRYQSSGTVDGFETNTWLEWHPDWLLIDSDGSGSHLLYDPVGVWGGQAGQLIQWVHADANYVKHSGIRAWIAVLVETLEAAIWNDEAELEADIFPWMNQELMARLDPGYPKDPIETD